MDSKASQSLIKFNEQMTHFCAFLEETFSSQPIVLSNVSLLKMFQKTNSRKVCEFFHNELGPYEKQINLMDENFFLELSRNNMEKYSESDYGNEICSVIELIHYHINDPVMSQPCPESPHETNKQRIWKYLKVLLFLSKKNY